MEQVRAEWFDDVPPTHEGPFGRAWKCADPTTELDDPRLPLYVPGTFFVLYAPLAHPYWSWHLLMTVKLDEIPGVAKPKLEYPGAKFEIMTFAIQPDYPPPDPRIYPLEIKPPVKLMEPIDNVTQFHGPTEEQLPEMVDLIAKSVTVGWIIPDTDYRRQWSATVKKTAEHYRGHPEFN